MKHPSSREFFAYWDAKRGDARAPDRSEIEPGAVRELLGDIFVLSYDNDAGYPFRVAGTRVSALLGRDLKDTSFSALFTPPHTRGRLLGLFLAVLELIKGRQIQAEQPEPFSEIWVSLAPPAAPSEPVPG